MPTDPENTPQNQTTPEPKPWEKYITLSNVSAANREKMGLMLDEFYASTEGKKLFDTIEKYHSEINNKVINFSDIPDAKDGSYFHKKDNLYFLNIHPSRTSYNLGDNGDFTEVNDFSKHTIEHELTHGMYQMLRDVNAERAKNGKPPVDEYIPNNIYTEEKITVANESFFLEKDGNRASDSYYLRFNEKNLKEIDKNNNKKLDKDEYQDLIENIDDNVETLTKKNEKLNKKLERNSNAEDEKKIRQEIDNNTTQMYYLSDAKCAVEEIGKKLGYYEEKQEIKLPEDKQHKQFDEEPEKGNSGGVGGAGNGSGNNPSTPNNTPNGGTNPGGVNSPGSPSGIPSGIPGAPSNPGGPQGGSTPSGPNGSTEGGLQQPATGQGASIPYTLPKNHGTPKDPVKKDTDTYVDGKTSDGAPAAPKDLIAGLADNPEMLKAVELLKAGFNAEVAQNQTESQKSPSKNGWNLG
jgi:hypothetical protein